MVAATDTVSVRSATRGAPEVVTAGAGSAAFTGGATDAVSGVMSAVASARPAATLSAMGAWANAVDPIARVRPSPAHPLGGGAVAARLFLMKLNQVELIRVLNADPLVPSWLRTL